ncbi:hypothetical protein HOE07_01920, partial [archaeon]|nr:hypothetical protein [archaeon]
MRGDFLKSKAVFMVFLIICLTFTVYNVKEVSAEQNVCCEQTETDWCVYTDEGNCISNGNAATSCEQTAYCKNGCCVSDLGKCSKNVPKSKCENTEGYTWQEGAECDVNVCEKNCCVIADYQCSYTTEDHCEYLIKDYEDIELDFRGVDSEYECSEICLASDKGCCVNDESCIYGTRGECDDPAMDINTGEGFYVDTVCTDIGFCSECTPCAETRCVQEDPYCFDSCGNQEGKADDCDYLSNTWCRQDGENAYCESIDCGSEVLFDGEYNIGLAGAEFIQRNPHDSKIGSEELGRSHGESWCLYESPAGMYKDFPGSQHYRTYCYFGEEIIEPCEDYRNQVCIQVPYTDVMDFSSEYAAKLGEYSLIHESDPTIVTSACLDNTNALINTTVTTVPFGGKFWDDGYSETCAVADIDCEMTFATSTWSDTDYEVGEGVMCTSPQWVKLVSEYCRSLGDCGVSTNLVEEFTDDGFYMTTSEEYLMPNEDIANEVKTYVGYDSCISSSDKSDQVTKVNSFEQTEIYCLSDCRGEECEFITTVDRNFYGNYMVGQSEYYQQPIPSEDEDTIVLSGGYPNILFDDDLGKNSYGVYGGMIGISQGLNEMNPADAGSINLAALYTLNGIGALINIIAGVTVLGAAATGIANSLGAVSGFMNGLSAFAEAGGTIASSTVGAVGSIISAVLNLALLFYTAFAYDNPIQRMDAYQNLAISTAISAGVSAVTAVLLAVAAGAGATANPVGAILAAGAAILAGLIALFSFGGQTKDITVTSHCSAWQPPTGGEYCELCDVPVSEGGLAIDVDGNILRGYECTEYKCRSLGWGCGFIEENLGSDRPKCVWDDPYDGKSPEIVKYMVDVSDTMNEKGISDTNGYVDVSQNEYSFVPGNGLAILPELYPFQYVTFGIETDELSQCMISQNASDISYEEMDMYFPDSYYQLQHNMSWMLTPEEEFNFYVRCQDHNGIPNDAFFNIQITTDEGEDITPVIIEATSINNYGYIPYGVNTTYITLYLNEPVQMCKWDTTDVDIALMGGYLSSTGCPATASGNFKLESSGPINVSEYENNLYFACQD